MRLNDTGWLPKWATRGRPVTVSGFYANGSTLALSVIFTPYTAGPTGRCGRRASPGRIAKAGYRKGWTGTDGWEPHRTANMSITSLRSTGGAGGIMGRAHWATWDATSWKRLSVY